jgi:hypothetical protein
MTDARKSLLTSGILCVLAFTAPITHAATAPADPCSLLSASDVSNAAGEAFGSPKSSVAPRPYANTVQGTDCRYESTHGSDTLLFRIYFDPSPDDATGLFAKLKLFYSPPTPVSGVGDEGYFDPRNGLHVRKGNVRYFLEGRLNNAQLQALAKVVAGKL